VRPKKLIQMAIIHQFPQYSPKAAKLWAEIPEQFQEKILDNVYCSYCQHSVRIVNYFGSIVSGDLVLKGSCAECGKNVARLLEGS